MEPFYRINDANVRTGIKVSGNDMLELVMAQDGKLICLWHDCSWSPKSGITKVLLEPSGGNFGI